MPESELRPEVLRAANAKSRRLRELVRAPGLLIMPGAYDALSARLFEELGFEAIQCTSGGIAAALGRPDGERVPREQTVEVSRRIADAVSVPVNADGERGYGDANEIGVTVRAFIQAGCAGMNLEDSGPHLAGQSWRLAPLASQLEKIQAIQATKRELGSEFFLNARVDVLMVMREDPQAALKEAILRGQAYAAAGADCVFFMAAVSRDTIRRLVKEVPAPVSVLAGPQTPPAAELQDLGVARVSYGYAFALVAATAIRRLAQEIKDSGTLSGLKDTMTVPEMNRLMEH